MNDVPPPTPPAHPPVAQTTRKAFTQPPEITPLIEPVEHNLVQRLAYSLQLQNDVFGEVHLFVLLGHGSCTTDQIERLTRLNAIHAKLLQTYAEVSKVGSRLHQLDQINPDAPYPPEEEVPF